MQAEIMKVIVGDYLHKTTSDAFAKAVNAIDDGSWGLPATEPVRPRLGTIGRNDPCPCGSGKKSKRCCR